MSELRKEQLDKICERQLFHLPYFRGMLRAVEQSQYPPDLLKEPILDIGAGDGHFAWAMLERKVVDGIDPWLVPLREAESWKVYRSLALANGQELPFESGQFPTAISNSVLEHIPGVQAVLNEVGRCLQPGGHFIFAVPNEALEPNCGAWKCWARSAWVSSRSIIRGFSIGFPACQPGYARSLGGTAADCRFWRGEALDYSPGKPCINWNADTLPTCQIYCGKSCLANGSYLRAERILSFILTAYASWWSRP